MPLTKANRDFTLTFARETPRRQGRQDLQPHQRCRCGVCRDCQENERWDRVFARFEVEKYWEDRGLFQSTLRGL
jgi:hypothetical protein